MIIGLFSPATSNMELYIATSLQHRIAVSDLTDAGANPLGRHAASACSIGSIERVETSGSLASETAS